MSSPNTTALNYNSYVQQIATLAVLNTQTVGGIVSGVDAYFNTLIPQMLNTAELRIQRDLDLMPALTTNTSYALTPGVNTLSISINDFVTLESVGIVVGTQTIQLIPASKEFILNVYNDYSQTGQPSCFAIYGGDSGTFGNTSQNILVGPWPALPYSVALTGTVRMPTLYQYAGSGSTAGTNTTFISTYLPDLLIQASMVYLSQFQRNFGAASNDPQMGVTYETAYQALLQGAKQEEYRKKWEVSAWSSSSQPVASTSGRGA